MSDTEQLFILAGIWALISLFVVYFVPGKPAKVTVFLLLVGVPFWELPFGYFNYSRLCSTEAKLQVFEKILPDDNLCIENLDSVLYYKLINSGFRRIEVTGGSDDKIRDAKGGHVFVTTPHEVKSRYCLRFVNNIKLPQRVLRHDQLIVRTIDGKVVARQSRVHWLGMWWQEAASPVVGRGGRCFEDPFLPLRIVRTGTD